MQPHTHLRLCQPHTQNTQDKDAKLRYLEKVVSAVGAATALPVPARPSKILAGLEPEATNVLLQMLAAAASGQDNSSGAVQTQFAAATASRPAPSTSRSTSDDSEAGAAPVVFSSGGLKLQALLPALARRVDEARISLTAAGAAPGSVAALQQCDQVAAIAMDAAVLSRCLEELRGSAAAIVGEGSAWGRKADKLAAQLQAEEHGEAVAAAAAKARLAGLEEQVGAARQRLAAAGVRA